MLPFRLISGALFSVLLSFSLADPVSAQVQEAIRKEATKNALLDSFYKPRNYQPVWNPDYLEGLTRFVEGLDAHGLPPRLFQLDVWRQAWSDPTLWQNPSPDPGALAKMDVGTTHLALYAIQAFAYGFVDPTEVHPKWKPIKRAVTATVFLDQALRQSPGGFAPFLFAKAPPQDPRYAEMINTLAKYRKIQSFGGWKPVPDPGRPVGPGDTYRDMELIQARLQAEGDLPATAPVRRSRRERFTLDQLTSDAIKSFQFRHGIAPDGYIGPKTLEELNYSTQNRIDTLIINIDRLRWMPRAYEEVEHVEVNIAESALRVFRDRQRITTMEVIVGKKGKSQTPVFHGEIKWLTFRPYWNIPPSIATRELVPDALAGDPIAYMQENRYEIVPFFEVSPDKVIPTTVENLQKVAAQKLLMRQGTGPGNALGLVKFIFPNDNSVYLHDTPKRHLFKEADRDFSHGCVRVSRPDELAAIMLSRNKAPWSIQDVTRAMEDEGNPNFKVHLDTPLPVYLMYWTSFIMGDGRVRFDQDIYGHDAIMKQRFGLQ